VILSSFPRIPHLPGSHASHDDLVLSDDETRRFFARPVVVLEKLDGLNVTLDLDRQGRVHAALKSEWRPTLARGVGRALDIWVRQRERALQSLLDDGTLYGEWLRHRVHVGYDALPDCFVGFAFWRRRGGFAPSSELSRRLRAHGITPVEPLFRGRLRQLSTLTSLVGRSRFGPSKMEGVIVEVDADASEHRFAKWVDPAYVHPQKGALAGTLNSVRLRR